MHKIISVALLGMAGASVVALEIPEWVKYIFIAVCLAGAIVAWNWPKLKLSSFMACFKRPVILYPIVALVGLPMGFLALVLFFYWLMFVPVYILSGFDMESTRTMMENISNLHREMLTK